MSSCITKETMCHFHLCHIFFSDTVVCNLVKKQVSALSDTRDSLCRVSESAENWLASQLPPMTDEWAWINYHF